MIRLICELDYSNILYSTTESAPHPLTHTAAESDVPITADSVNEHARSFLNFWSSYFGFNTELNDAPLPGIDGEEVSSAFSSILSGLVDLVNIDSVPKSSSLMSLTEPFREVFDIVMEDMNIDEEQGMLCS